MTMDPIQARKLTLKDLDILDIELGPTEIIEAAILAIRTVTMTEDGRKVSMVIAMSEGLDFMIKRGMLELLHDEALEGEEEAL